MRRAKLFAAALLLSTTGLPGAAAEPHPFNATVVFGDSLSDNGNDSILFAYDQRQRFTTNPGIVAAENVAKRYGLSLEPSLAGGSDHAFGGAGLVRNWPNSFPLGAPDLPNPFPVPNLPAQISSYLSAHPQLDPNTLYSISGGESDVLYHVAALAAGSISDRLIARANASADFAARIRASIASQFGVDSVETLGQAVPQVAAAAQVETDLVARLQTAGARRIIVFNLPDLGIGNVTDATTLSQVYNRALNSGLAGRSGILPVDVYRLIDEVAANPVPYGFKNASSDACTLVPALICTPENLVEPNASSTYVFASGVGPGDVFYGFDLTTAAHALLADAVIGELTAPGQASLLPEAPLALLRGQRSVVREELNRAPEANQGWTLFVTGRAGGRRLTGDFAAPSAKSDDQAITGGAIWRSGGSLVVGLALTGGKSRVQLEDQLGRFDATEFAGSVFAQYSWPSQAWASLQAGLGRTDYSNIDRSLALGDAIRTEHGNTGGHDYSAEVAGGQWLALGGLRTGPFAAFAYDHVHVDGLAEIGADSTAMWFAPQARDASVVRIGWSLDGGARFAAVALRPVASVAYAHDFSADRRSVTAGLTGLNGQFDMPGAQPSRNWGEVSLGVETQVVAGLHARLSYEGLFGDRGHENLGALAVSYSF
jgi:outer membrane lipase/esterase